VGCQGRAAASNEVRTANTATTIVMLWIVLAELGGWAEIPLRNSFKEWLTGPRETNAHHYQAVAKATKKAAKPTHENRLSAGVKVKNGSDGSVNVNRGGVKVQGGGGSNVKVKPGRNGSANMKGPNGLGGSLSW
jgi:hypothetical protein